MSRQPRPVHIEVRMYQVGFGDCFVVTFRYARPLRDGRRERHMLIDFGSTHAPVNQRLNMAKVATQIADDCDGRLDVLVVTHRHRDHLSGFANDSAAATIAALEPSLIVQPWTEHPTIPADATTAIGSDSRRLLRALAAGDQFANALARQLGTGARGLSDDVRALAELQIANAEAVQWLARQANEHDSNYLHADQPTKIPSIIPGIRVQVLGPPTVDQYAKVVYSRAQDPQYWMLYHGLVTTGLAAAHTIDSAAATDGPASGDLAARLLEFPPGPTRWLAARLGRQRLHSFQRIVRSLDDTLNNTSLILLVTVGTKHLLFPGDAQIENWGYILGKLRTRRALEGKLRELDLYKVGHHGSRNATPRDLVGLWGNDSDLVSLLSTRPGVHGKTEATAVPRATLLTALEDRSRLFSTEDVSTDPVVVVETDPTTNEPFQPRRTRATRELER